MSLSLLFPARQDCGGSQLPILVYEALNGWASAWLSAASPALLPEAPDSPACFPCSSLPSLYSPTLLPANPFPQTPGRLCSPEVTALLSCLHCVAILVKVTSPTWTAYLFTLFIFSIVLDRVP